MLIIQEEEKDLLFILTDRNNGCILSYKEKEDGNCEIVTKASGDLSVSGRLPAFSLWTVVQHWWQLLCTNTLGMSGNS